MSRRGRTGPSISLFAFQDIITSVTAIVIVVALFLALDLVQRKEMDHAETPATMAQDLDTRIERLQAELDLLREQTARADSTVLDAAHLSPSELQAEVDNLEGSIRDLHSEEKVLAERHRKWLLRQRAILTRKFELRPAELELERQRNSNRELEREIAEAQSDSRPIYALPRGVQTGGWIVVIGKNSVAVAPMGRRAKPELFEGGNSFLSSGPAKQFLSWVVANRLQDSYFLLLIRPGGASHFDEIDTRFSSLGVSFGFDLVDGQQEILHAEKGAAP